MTQPATVNRLRCQEPGCLEPATMKARIRNSDTGETLRIEYLCDVHVELWRTFERKPR